MNFKILDSLKIIAILNIIFAIIVFLDVLLPVDYEESQKYDRILISNERHYKSREIKNLLVCQNGDAYRLGRVPDDLLAVKQGENIKVIRSRIFSKVNKIVVQRGKKRTHFYVSFFSNFFILILYTISLIYLIFYISRKNFESEVGLPFSTALIFFVSGVYLIFL